MQLSTFLYRNGILPPRPSPRASVVTRKQSKSESDSVGAPIKIRVVLSRPLRVKAGQYINLWIPSVSLWSWVQTHPFMVTSWAPVEQDILELFVQTRHGLTKRLHALAALEGSASFSTFITGPHGSSEPVSQYESVLVIASDFGIAGTVSYIKQLVYRYNTTTSQVLRVHLVWQVQTLDIAIAAQPFLNSLLDEDIPDDDTSHARERETSGKRRRQHVLEMSFYLQSKEDKKNEKLFGKHNRATVHRGMPNYEEIISAEVSGDHIAKLSSTREERGEMLIMGEYIVMRNPYPR
ncbi:hypothetical protein EYZ11_006947 [Aspergillus tanneri]|uniref:ferric-chelate reductase (NADPH) n=1 Tax=Aspergillus tanneri TaxID=1220188 RepID=A0A4V3UP37_9EURO|nr:uncharacterized protein ATNIH1004_011525 [Aspergillus tanneri]KAA8642580.1 hypothetical protein ATNIH1004_011525 [Aspergillus tanneri]THC93594.1 hypothetical protein EYZ11_006947 [Aspergillus tanneri]